MDTELPRIRIGERIGERRKRMSLTQAELAERVGLSRAMVAHYERGFRTPSPGVLEQLATVFGEDLDLLVASTDAEDRYAERPSQLICPNPLCRGIEWNPTAGDPDVFRSSGRRTFSVHDRAGKRREYCTSCGTRLLGTCGCGRAFEQDDWYCARCAAPIREHVCSACRRPLTKSLQPDPETDERVVAPDFWVDPDGTTACDDCARAQPQTVRPEEA